MIKLTLIQGDCLQVLPIIPDESIDLIVTSPPYNLQKEYGNYNDSMNYEDYLFFLDMTWKNCYRLLKSDGRICINIGNVSINNRAFTIGHISQQLEKIGFIYRDFVIWNKQNIHKRTAWGSWLSPSCPYLIQPFEYIIIYNKNSFKKKGENTDLTKEEFINWTNALWTFKAETKIRDHPAPFPEELPLRCIKLFSFVGDTILDPFLGSGTTMKVAKDLNRNCIGIELNPKYIKLCKERLNWGSSLDENIKFDFKDLSEKF